MKKLNRNAFWAIVDKMEWGSDCNYDRISSEIVAGDYGNMDYMICFLNTWKEVEAELNTVVDNMSDREYTKYIDKSDDGLSDLLAHIIGLGQKHYEKVTDNPKEFYEYTDSARESFGYVLHNIYDWIDVRKNENDGDNEINRELRIRDLEYKKENLLDRPYREVAVEVTAIDVEISNLQNS